MSGRDSAKKPVGRERARDTATFTPYYWEAYNEIVEPRRFDHYLIRRWLPELGALGFAIVKALRDRCYHNPTEGVLRDSCEVDMGELAQCVGTSRPTLFREFQRNAALGQFVRRIEQFAMRGGKPHQSENRFQVCMDEPIHPDDMERYDLLRAQKEHERNQPVPTRIVKPEKAEGKVGGKGYESQIETHKGKSPAYESQFETHESQIETPGTTFLPSHSDTPNDYLPSGGVFTKDSLTPHPEGARGGIPPINPPKGEGEEGESPDPLTITWSLCLGILAATVNAPTLNGHLKGMRLESLEKNEAVVTAALRCPSAFTREWVEKRHAEGIRDALAEVLRRDAASVSVEIRGPQK